MLNEPRPKAVISNRDQDATSLTPWEKNPRQHPAGQKAKLKANIRRFGFTAPLLVTETGVILCGHARREVAVELGLKAVPTRVISGLTEADQRTLVLSDNKLGLLSSWDPDLLKGEIQLLMADEFDIEFTGFSTAEVDVMLETVGDGTVDELPAGVEELPVTSRPGDLWVCGDHRIYCGSALEAASYEPLLRGNWPRWSSPIPRTTCPSRVTSVATARSSTPSSRWPAAR